MPFGLPLGSLWDAFGLPLGVLGVPLEFLGEHCGSIGVLWSNLAPQFALLGSKVARGHPKYHFLCDSRVVF